MHVQGDLVGSSKGLANMPCVAQCCLIRRAPEGCSCCAVCYNSGLGKYTPVARISVGAMAVIAVVFSVGECAQ